MIMNKMKVACMAATLFFACGQAAATVVEVQTVVGNFKINLFDEQTPETVNNFLEYVRSGAYANTVVHRSDPSFVIQMGGFAYSPGQLPEAISVGPTVINEPELSNVLGTVAMAKLASDENSATSQFFINLDDNTGLDSNNGGFTVFGQVLDDGMEVVNAIADIPRVAFAVPFNELPVRNYTQADASNNVIPTDDNLVIVLDVVIIDDTVITNPQLVPVPNTAFDSPVFLPVPIETSSSGGAIAWFSLLLLSVIAIQRRTRALGL